MSVITRDFDFTPGTTIVSADVDSEFDKLYKLLNGTDTTNAVGIRKATPISGDPALMVLGQIELENASAGRVFALYKTGDSNPRIDIFNTGQIRIVGSQMTATPSVQYLIAGGVLYVRNSNVGNVGAGEDDLYSLTIGANVMASTTPSVMKVRACGNTAANANNKRFRFYVKTGLVSGADSGVINPNNKPFFWEFEIYSSVGTSEWRVVGTFKCDTTELRFNTVVAGVDHTVDNLIKFTAEAVANDDIVMTNLSIWKGWGLN